MQLSTRVHNRLVQDPNILQSCQWLVLYLAALNFHLITRWCSRLITILLLHHHETLVQNLVLARHESQETAGWFLSGLLQDLM